jgi:hypothetical protein
VGREEIIGTPRSHIAGKGVSRVVSIVAAHASPSR